MAAFEKINDDMLENVVGGHQHVINTHTGQKAVIRSSPSLNSAKKTSLSNGQVVNVCGEGVFNYDDGRTWYPIDSPLKGWVVGRSVGLYEQ
jgi:bacteriocin-like protein